MIKLLDLINACDDAFVPVEGSWLTYSIRGHKVIGVIAKCDLEVNKEETLLLMFFSDETKSDQCIRRLIIPPQLIAKADFDKRYCKPTEVRFAAHVPTRFHFYVLGSREDYGEARFVDQTGASCDNPGVLCGPYYASSLEMIEIKLGLALGIIKSHEEWINLKPESHSKTNIVVQNNLEFFAEIRVRLSDLVDTDHIHLLESKLASKITDQRIGELIEVGTDRDTLHLLFDILGTKKDEFQDLIKSVLRSHSILNYGVTFDEPTS